MGRSYRLTVSGVAVSAAQDLLQINGATGKCYFIRRIWVGCTDTAVATGQMLQLRARFLPATVTNGSGGTTGLTPAKNDPGDAAASNSTCCANSTTPATTNGTAVVLYENGCHLYQGDNWRFDSSPPIGPSEAFVYELRSTVSGTVHLSAGCEIEEFLG
jgi:hypothetical protein